MVRSLRAPIIKAGPCSIMGKSAFGVVRELEVKNFRGVRGAV
ncbi:hypothetical protein [Pyrobaculum islandicum]|nr:hypothetical protein [Pyrobaculum islandicum]